MHFHEKKKRFKKLFFHYFIELGQLMINYYIYLADVFTSPNLKPILLQDWAASTYTEKKSPFTNGKTLKNVINMEIIQIPNDGQYYGQMGLAQQFLMMRKKIIFLGILY